ncbi:heat shock 70 kDa protein 14-like [Diaphorina citri]|uniref:Hypoxia up-regulated protein 1 n=1 Tax=Diaphorina citri TaxID=121845 RepID=A0A3Q0IZQ5_DIACI|nr:heat shock 70 kDa protein 14-like [Diaphorina citri]
MHVLSTLQSSNVFVESLYDGLDFHHNVSRARFESLIGGLLTSFVQPCMHVLSTLQSSNVFVESLYDGLDFHHNVSRARFESLIGGLLTSFVQPIEDVLSRSNITHDQINKV